MSAPGEKYEYRLNVLYLKYVNKQIALLLLHQDETIPGRIVIEFASESENVIRLHYTKRSRSRFV